MSHSVDSYYWEKRKKGSGEGMMVYAQQVWKAGLNKD
jgi:hypothetical protein